MKWYTVTYIARVYKSLQIVHVYQIRVFIISGHRAESVYDRVLLLYTDMKSLMMKKYKISQEDYKMLEIVVTENKPYKSGPQWKFAGSFYFATVVLAMIGKSIAGDAGAGPLAPVRHWMYRVS